jgi:hypothetical protein
MTTFRTLKTLTAAGLLLAFAATGLAQAPKANKETPPPPAPAKDVRFPAFEEKTLANGLRVVVIEQHEQPLVSLRMMAWPMLRRTSSPRARPPARPSSSPSSSTSSAATSEPTPAPRPVTPRPPSRRTSSTSGSTSSPT